MAVNVLTVEKFLDAAHKHADIEFEMDAERQAWIDACIRITQRAHDRGDGVAVYANNDLGHPDIGQWQVVSYGGADAQLETRHAPTGSACFQHRKDVIPKTLPDIGGSINYRYLLEAIVPAPRALNDPIVDRCGRDAADCDCKEI